MAQSIRPMNMQSNYAEVALPASSQGRGLSMSPPNAGAKNQFDNSTYTDLQGNPQASIAGMQTMQEAGQNAQTAQFQRIAGTQGAMTAAATSADNAHNMAQENLKSYVAQQMLASDTGGTGMMRFQAEMEAPGGKEKMYNALATTQAMAQQLAA